MNYLCNVCGKSIGWNAPSGVCSTECLVIGQSCTSIEERKAAIARTVKQAERDEYEEACRIAQQERYDAENEANDANAYDACPECQRSYGRHYSGPCTH